MLSLPLSYYVFSILIVYMPFHFFEEAMGNFPETMYQHKWIPERISYGHWMANNVFFYYPTLLFGSISYFFFPKLVFIGLGVLIWGVINTFDHLFYTIKDMKISPGIFTGLIYLLIAIIGLVSIKQELNAVTIVFGMLCGIFYFVFPILCCSTFDKKFRAVFK